jgi:DNA-directed RNA polymerase specialized sigma24 family protein
MRYIINPAGNRIVDAIPKDIRALRPSIAMNMRWRHISEADVEDFCQEVEIITWQAVVDRRIIGNRFARPVDALLHFMLAVAHNLWRNHRRKRWVWREVLATDENDVSDIVGPDPQGQLDARETLLRLTTHEDVARFLLDAATLPTAERYGDLTPGTHGRRLLKARSWARDVDAGKWKEPRQPTQPTPWHRKKKR